MADIEVTSTCEEGYTVESVINGEWELVVDALSNDGPSANEVLAADYASCYIPAFRVAADKHGYDDVGNIEVDVEADLDEDDDLVSIAFDMSVEEDLGDDEQDIVELGEDICHVHSALREELHADITIESGV
ncbi:OsmC family protein [Halomicroarcula sp. S1AR25-4]|uniref:OsmC family protein n=1 Tax=Haloarcula sp. S1AR25-4 TaxID=2950538 RepID=UPI002876803E|nr:OsmC family protein [Halomicroarcula sp. S1AR25-4]MDS0276323.1 OsmC family protein [Halomicroarcula sp. S1AR25-4]